MRPARWFLVMSASIGLVGASCGGGGGGAGSTPTSPPAVVTSPPSTTSASPSATAGATTLVTIDNQFQPSTISVAAGSEFLINNQGQNLHNFTISGHSAVDIQPGATIPGTALIANLSPGSYDFFCKYRKSQGMTGTLTIT
jgi:plastocyanin